MSEHNRSAQMGPTLSPTEGARRPPRRAAYLSISGDGFYEATIVAERLDGRVDIDVWLPGCSEPTRLTRVPFHKDSAATCPRGSCV